MLVMDDAQAFSVYKSIEAINLNYSFERAMLGEHNTSLKTFQDCRTRPEAFTESVELMNIFNPDLTLKYKAFLLRYTWKPVLSSADMAVHLKCLQRATEASRLSYYKAKNKGLLYDEEKLPSYAVITNLMASIYMRGYAASESAMAHADGSRIFLALQAYKSRFDSYPSSLQELRKKIGWNIPKDRFTGNDFVYKRKGSGFLLYSVGLDQKDDGGKPTPGGSEPRDIVWKVER